MKKLLSNKDKFLMFLLALALLCTGCSKDYLDPSQIGRFRPTPVVNVILDSLGVMEESESPYANAEEPRPEDLFPSQRDYVFGSGDVLTVSIYELQMANITYVNYFTVTESGYVSIPDVGPVQAAGMTEIELEEAIRDLLMPDLIKNPSVTVSLNQSQRLVFSINGEGIRRPDQYGIPRYDDFRLSRAIAMAGSTAQFNVSYIYVTRQLDGNESALPQTEKGYAYNKKKSSKTTSQIAFASSFKDKQLSILQPYDKNNRTTIMTGSEMLTSAELEETVPSIDDDARIEWVFEDGKYVPVRIGDEKQGQVEAQAQTEIVTTEGIEEIEGIGEVEIIEEIEDPQAIAITPVEPPAIFSKQATPLDQYVWEQMSDSGNLMRVIKIPTKALLGGDPRYDIIIKPGDSITVPVDVTGEYSIMGNVNFTGFISLQGRPITLKQAIAAAGGLGELAWPKKVEVIRRIGGNKEVIVMVDLDKIAKGQQPDFFIKPHDLINVGTHGSSRYLAVLRTAFRATYGFGFLYDRNFATRDFGNKPFDDITMPF